MFGCDSLAAALTSRSNRLTVASSFVMDDEYDDPCDDTDDEDDGGYADGEDDDGREEEACSQCLHFGDYQCEKHGAAAIEAQRQYAEFNMLKDALEGVLALPDAWSSPAYARLQTAAREVLAEMEKVG